jgi:hypothetical protein
MAEQRAQCELSEQLRSWAESETLEDSREHLRRLAEEYENVAEPVAGSEIRAAA